MTDDDILAEMEAGFGDVREPDIEDLTKLSDFGLASRLAKARTELYDRQEMRSGATTERGRELHSVRAACLIEMRRRRQRH